MKYKSKRTKIILFILSPISVSVVSAIAWQSRVRSNNRAVNTVWKEHLTTSKSGHCACCQERPNGEIAAQLVRFQTDDITTWSSFPGGRLYTKTESYGYLFSNGKVAIPAKYFAASTVFSEGLASVTASGRPVDSSTGYISSSGGWVVPPSYVDAFDFKCGRGRFYVSARDGERIYGYVKHDGTKVGGPLYGSATDFHCGVALVGIEQLWSRFLVRGYFIQAIGGDMGLRRSYIYKLIDVDGNTLSKDDVANMDNANNNHNNRVE